MINMCQRTKLMSLQHSNADDDSKEYIPYPIMPLHQHRVSISSHGGQPMPMPIATADQQQNAVYQNAQSLPHVVIKPMYYAQQPQPQPHGHPLSRHGHPLTLQTTQSKHKLKKYRIENETFRLWPYYKPTSKKLLGKGGYGVVMEAMDVRLNQKVAIKKMKNVFTHLNTAKCSLRELKLLMHFDHESIIRVTDCVVPESKNSASFQAVYYVMPKMTSTLKMVCCYQDRIEISSNHRCYIMFQIFSGLKYIHGCGVIHRDLKPENILINADCSIKITDFGMARGVNDEHDDAYDVDGEGDLVLSEYVTTRWYRAPEIMLCSRKYRFSVDVWSMGCIWAELIQRKPIFCGNNHLEQLNVIFDAVGTPNKLDAMSWIKSRDALQWVLSLKKRKTQCFYSQVFDISAKEYKKMNKQEIDLLSKLLILNPNRRISVDHVLRHKFFKKIPKHFHSKKVAAKFDQNQIFEKSLRSISNCREVMLSTLRELHSNGLSEYEEQRNVDNSDSSQSTPRS